MAGMLQILTYLLAFYLIVKGVEVLQIGLASTRTDRRPLIVLGGLTLAACIIAAFVCVGLQDSQAQSIANVASSY